MANVSIGTVSLCMSSDMSIYEATVEYTFDPAAPEAFPNQRTYHSYGGNFVTVNDILLWEALERIGGQSFAHKRDGWFYGVPGVINQPMVSLLELKLSDFLEREELDQQWQYSRDDIVMFYRWMLYWMNSALSEPLPAICIDKYKGKFTYGK